MIDDAGFSLVEVLVALAVGSFVLIGVGSILSMTASSQRRVVESEAIINLLVDVKVLTSELAKESYVPSALGSDTLLLSPASGSGSQLVLELSDDHVLTVERDDQQLARLDFGTFDEVQLQTFRPINGAYSWLSLDDRQIEEVSLIRLGLKKLHRSWSVVIWHSGARLSQSVRTPL